MHVFQFLLCLSLLIPWATVAHSQQTGGECPRPLAMEEGAFERPMVFSMATSKGNMTTSTWIAATGRIELDSADRFREFLARENLTQSQVVLHSPGGSLQAGMELGRLFREHGMTTHIGRTRRDIESYASPCDTWFDMVEAGICASSCAYAFLGGEVRFVDSPYYPTENSRLGFHQFYRGSSEEGAEMLTSQQVAELRSSTLSVAQAVTGQIVLYAMEMGIDPRIVALAAATPSDSLYFPTAAEMEELSIASGKGLSTWFMEPYSDGLVTATRPNRSDSVLQQVTAFCSGPSGEPKLLIKMRMGSTGDPDPVRSYVNAILISVDSKTYAIPKSDLSIRYEGGSAFLTVPVVGLPSLLVSAHRLEFGIDAARVMGLFQEGGELDPMSRSALALAWKNCI
ncbi:hypothetical protein SAMN06265378_11640 [Paracoccus sediminis]|nr:hypothetical protein SAMN06265378_11640 [Paracoccus sediminis]